MSTLFPGEDFYKPNLPNLQNNNQNNSKKDKDKAKKRWFRLFVVGLIIVVVIYAIASATTSVFGNLKQKLITYNSYLSQEFDKSLIIPTELTNQDYDSMKQNIVNSCFDIFDENQNVVLDKLNSENITLLNTVEFTFSEYAAFINHSLLSDTASNRYELKYLSIFNENDQIKFHTVTHISVKNIISDFGVTNINFTNNVYLTMYNQINQSASNVLEFVGNDSYLFNNLDADKNQEIGEFFNAIVVTNSNINFVNVFPKFMVDFTNEIALKTGSTVVLTNNSIIFQK